MDKENEIYKAEPESIRIAMDQAWRDHHHARDQTWKTIQIEAVLGAGLVTVAVQFSNKWATLAAGGLVIMAALFGIVITLHHRKLEIRKFIHIINCEEMLGLHRDDLIPYYPEYGSLESKPKRVQDSAVWEPDKIDLWHIIHPGKHSTSLFILRMHVAIFLFAALYTYLQYKKG